LATDQPELIRKQAIIGYWSNAVFDNQMGMKISMSPSIPADLASAV
jgi:hypothetical protein